MSPVAAIDCGTNSLRLLIADLGKRRNGTRMLTDLQREMQIVRLGQGVDATGRISEESLERTRAVLAEYARACEDSGVERVRMVATSATRDASNREDFFGMVRSTLGVDAEVITGLQEAELSFAGAVADLDPKAGPFVLTDLGGGSTELVLGHWDGVEAQVEQSFSANIGCVRLTERCLPTDPPSAEEIAEARRVARSVLDEAFSVVDTSGARTWVGVAGTVTTVSAISQGLPEYDPRRIHLSTVSRQGVSTVARDLLAMSHDERAAIGSMHPGRVDVIGAGALITDVLAEELAERAGISTLVVSEHDILDGIALSLG